mgnify:CR=1 FL=1
MQVPKATGQLLRQNCCTGTEHRRKGECEVSTKGLTIGFFIADAALIALCAFFYLQMDRTAPVITLPDTEQTYTTGTNTHQLLEA